MAERADRIQIAWHEFEAVLFDLDGVVTDTASVHLAAWTRMFNEFLSQYCRERGLPFKPFRPQDYRQYVDGRPRLDGLRAFLTSRQIELPEGTPDDGPDDLTVHGLGERKTGYFLEQIRAEGVTTYTSTLDLIERLRAAGLLIGLVTASRNRREILRAAGIEGLFDATVDGIDRAELALPGKPHPDTFVEAARRLGTAPERSVVVEDATAGVAAGRRGGFALVIGVDRVGQPEALREAGADIVVSDLAEITIRRAAVAADGAPPSDAEEISDPWLWVYDSFEPAEEGRRETLLALGNGYFVTRGAASDARADGVHYPGTYLAGGYNRLVSIIEGEEFEHEDLVNLPNWLPLTFRIDDGEWFTLEAVEILEYRQTLDLRRGLYERNTTVRDPAGRETQLRERRFVHMQNPHLAGQHLEITARNWSGRLTVQALLDGDVTNSGVERYLPFKDRHIDVVQTSAPDDETVLLHVETTQSQLRVTQAARLRTSGGINHPQRRVIQEERRIGQEIAMEVEAGGRVQVEKIVAFHTSRDRASADPITDALETLRRAGDFDELLKPHVLAWAHLWWHADLDTVEVDADASRLTHLVVRLHIFHLLQTASPHTMELDAGIPARGWHGEGYRGHIFWDELFIFPFLVLQLPLMARSLLVYRYRRLPAARIAAEEAGYRGAMYPWQSGSTGRDETDLKFLNPRSGRWIKDDTHLQRHVGAAVAYNVWQYYQATGDTAFLVMYGGEMLLEIARFWASIAEWNPERERYDIRNVLGPDEFHDRYPGSDRPGLNNNAYTNVMAAWCLVRALDMFDILPAERCRELRELLRITRDEIERWDEISRKLYLPRNEEGMLWQFEGYDQLQEFDWDAYRERYGNIMRLDLILESEGDSPNRYRLSKQADVLMLFYLLPSTEVAALFERLGYDFDPEIIPTTIDYYLQRTSHGSTLSGVVHAWVLARSERTGSWPLFLQALRSDIDDIQGGTTAEGIHLGAMAGTVDILLSCYTGLVLHGDELRFHPILPDEVTRLSFELRYRGHSLSIDVTRRAMTVSSAPVEAGEIAITVRDHSFVLQPGERRSVPLAPPNSETRTLVH